MFPPVRPGKTHELLVVLMRVDNVLLMREIQTLIVFADICYPHL